MITVESVTKTYGAFTAVADVTFTASSGRVTGFLGPKRSVAGPPARRRAVDLGPFGGEER